MPTTSVTQTLSDVQRMLDNSSDNLRRLDDPNARKLESSMISDRTGPEGLLRTGLKLSRNIDPLQEKVHIEQISVLENKNTYATFLDQVQSVITAADNPQKSILVEDMDLFFQSAKKLESNNSSAMRQTFVDKAKQVSDTLSNAFSKVSDLRLEADKRLASSTNDVNNAIRSLFSLNQEILRSSVPIKLYDTRDTLVRDLALNFDIKVSYGNNGIAQVTSKSGDLLVSGEEYVQFKYNGALNKDRILNDTGLPDLTMNKYNKFNKIIHSTSSSYGASNSADMFTGGKWSALVDLRDKTLPEISGAINTLTSNFVKQVNTAHNSGSTFPPKGFFESSMEVSGNQAIDDIDSFTIFAVNEKGIQLKGGAGKINPVTIDMKNLTSITGGAPTVANLISELNQQLDKSPSRERAAMGTILGAGNIQMPGEYLLNNIQLKANSVVAPANGNFTFELDLQGNSHFGSKIEVLSVETADDVSGTNSKSVANADLPEAFVLGKDQNVATGQLITVSDAGANRVITLEIRVTGDNGVVNTGKVSFAANAQIGINDRIAFNSNLSGGVGITTGDFDHSADPVPLTSHSGVAKAKLVDSNGNIIDPNSGQTGRLVIESNNPNYRMAFQGGNFGSYFGFNNLFQHEEQTGSLKVKQEIIDDVNQLSISQAQKNAGDSVVHSVGDVHAGGKLNFDIASLLDNDTVTIGGEVFTFKNVLTIPANPNEVLLSDALAGTDGLLNKIQNHPDLSSRVNVTLDGASILSISAATAGTSGNDIEVEFTGTNPIAAYLPGNIVPPFMFPAFSNSNVGSNLADGTNKFVSEKIYSYNVAPSKQVIGAISNLQSSLVLIEAQGIVPENVSSLSGFATIVTGLLSSYITAAEENAQVAATVLTHIDDLTKKTAGIDRNEEYFKALDLAQYMNTLAHLQSTEQKSRVKVEDILFG